MSILEAILLGIIQGLTEFLPISSSGHIELGKALLGVKGADDLTFTLLVHGATVLSIFVVFWKDIKELFISFFGFKWDENNQYTAKLALSCLPILYVGLFHEDDVNAFFSGNLVLVGACLIVTGLILLLTTLERSERREVTFKDALIIGVAQVIAILPGISRSGTTISTALALGVAKDKAARFSFLMILAPILGATLLKCKDLFEAEASTSISSNFLPYLFGFIAAFVSGVLACRLMLRLVQEGKIVYFSIYCFIIGLIAMMIGWMF